MGYYNWEKIMIDNSDAELLRIYKDQKREPKEKVEAAIAELKKRKLIDSESMEVLQTQENEIIYEPNTIFEVKPNRNRAVLARNIILIIAILDVISIVSSYLQYELLVSMKNEITLVDKNIISSNDFRELTISIVYLVFYIISTITFLQWFNRAYSNLNNRISGCLYTKGWSIGSWFVPIISLFRPYQIMKELYVKTDRILKKRGKIDNTTSIDLRIIELWWGLWIVSHYIGQYILRTTFRAETIDAYINGTLGDIGISILGIPLAIATAIIINRHSKDEELLYDDEIYAKKQFIK